MKLSVVILTMGDRPGELRRAIASALAQTAVDMEVIVIGNGADVPGPPPGVTVISLPDNLGVAAGRNAGAGAAVGDVIAFLDDDGWYPDHSVGSRLAARFAADPVLAVIALRVVNPAGGPGARWHVPRLRAGDPGRSSPVTTFAGGACALRRSAFLAAGGLPEEFFYAHEETDLAWRLIGLGYRLEYDAGLRMCHHSMPNSRHPTFHRLDGRNRVLLARRNLPWPLGAAYLLNWFLLTIARERRATVVRAWVSGFAEGWRMNPGPRRPLSGSAAWRMTRAGRPPII